MARLLHVPKKPDFTCAGLFLGTRRLGARHSETRPRPAQSLSQDFCSLFTDKEGASKALSGSEPILFHPGVEKGLLGRGKKHNTPAGVFSSPRRHFSVPVRQRQSQNQSRWQRPEFEPEHRPIAASHGQSEVTERGAHGAQKQQRQAPEPAPRAHSRRLEPKLTKQRSQAVGPSSRAGARTRAKVRAGSQIAARARQPVQTVRA